MRRFLQDAPHGQPGPCATGQSRCGRQDSPRCHRERAVGFNATFLRDVNYPDGAIVAPGGKILKQWEFVNPSDSPQWPEGTKMIFVRGNRDILGEETEFPLPRASPGEKVVFSVELKIPQAPGRCKIKFRIADRDGKVFGDKCWAELMVTKPEAKSELPADAPPAPASAKGKSELPAAPAAAPVAPAAASVPAPSAPAAKGKTELSASPVASEVGSQAPKPDVKDATPEVYADQLALLDSMGFKNRDLNKYLLGKCGGDVQRVAMWLLDMNAYKV